MTRKTIAHYLTDLRTDLKDSGALWTDAELTRCVERAVADYSRFVPREMSKEITVDTEVTGESFTTPAATSAGYFVAAMDISASADGATATLAAIKPDVPRPVKIAITDANASITQLVLIVKGYDDDNNYIEEFFYLEGGLTQTGEHYFALVTQVEIDEIAGNGAADVLNVGTGAADGVYVKLANKPIRTDSDSITGKKLDTDYEMDYGGGRIAMKSGGSLVAGSAYTIAYTKSRIDVDLSTIIDDLIRIDRVEYPAGYVPQKFSEIELWGNILTLTGGFESQKEVSDEEHIIIRYLTSHSPPSAQAPGSFPSYLDTTIQQAATAYALFIEALQYEHQAVTDLASGRTSLSNIAAVHTLIVAALLKVATHVGETDTALDAAIVQFAAAATALGKINSDGGRTYLTDADTALDAAAVAAAAGTTALAKILTYLEGASESSKALLAQIATDIAELRTAIKTAEDAANTHLDEVDTTDLGKASVGAEAYTETGDDFINKVNDGEKVAELYADYARTRALIGNTRIGAAAAFISEAGMRLSNLRGYIEQANAYGAVALGFAEEGKGRAAISNAYTAEASQRVAIADRYISEARERSTAGAGYVSEASNRLGMSNSYIQEANSRLVEITRYLEEAALYQQSADRSLVLAEKFRIEAIERRNEAWAIWRSPRQISPAYALGQRRQLVSG